MLLNWEAVFIYPVFEGFNGSLYFPLTAFHPDNEDFGFSWHLHKTWGFAFTPKPRPDCSGAGQGAKSPDLVGYGIGIGIGGSLGSIQLICLLSKRFQPVG